MNKFIPLVMDDLVNPSKYTQEQKEANRESAADYWVNHCFEVTDEGKTTYINKLKGK